MGDVYEIDVAKCVLVEFDNEFGQGQPNISGRWVRIVAIRLW